MAPSDLRPARPASPLRLEIRGRVQGVGYRWAMVERARQLGVCGWVRNRRDGSVEALVAGSPGAVEPLLAWARQGPGPAVVETVELHAVVGTADVPDPFEQRPTA